MAKAYWVSAYRSISDPDKLAAYAKLAAPAIQAAGGRFLARGVAAKTYENGMAQRTTLIEFDSVEQAIAAHEVDLVVGTHAVIQEDVHFARLGLAIVAEYARILGASLQLEAGEDGCGLRVGLVLASPAQTAPAQSRLG